VTYNLVEKDLRTSSKRTLAFGYALRPNDKNRLVGTVVWELDLAAQYEAVFMPHSFWKSMQANGHGMRPQVVDVRYAAENDGKGEFFGIPNKNTGELIDLTEINPGVNITPPAQSNVPSLPSSIQGEYRAYLRAFQGLLVELGRSVQPQADADVYHGNGAADAKDKTSLPDKYLCDYFGE